MGGEKYSSLELDATAVAGVAALTVGLVSGGGEAELNDESGDDGCVSMWALARVIIPVVFLIHFFWFYDGLDSRHSKHFQQIFFFFHLSCCSFWFLL